MVWDGVLLGYLSVFYYVFGVRYLSRFVFCGMGVGWSVYEVLIADLFRRVIVVRVFLGAVDCSECCYFACVNGVVAVDRERNWWILGASFFYAYNEYHVCFLGDLESGAAYGTNYGSAVAFVGRSICVECGSELLGVELDLCVIESFDSWL